MVDENDLTLDDLDAVYPKRQLSSEKTNNLKQMAVRFTNQVQGGSVATLHEIEGSEEDFTVLVWAHLCELRSGEETSEAQSGGSVAYSRTAGDLSTTLSETRFGRMARSYLRGQQSYGIVKGRSRFR